MIINSSKQKNITIQNTWKKIITVTLNDSLARLFVPWTKHGEMRQLKNVFSQVFCFYITGHLEEIFTEEHRKEMLRYIYCYQVQSRTYLVVAYIPKYLEGILFHL